MLKNPLNVNSFFSVCMSVYKNDLPENFYLSIKSVINQTVSPGEIVLVVDGPVVSEISDLIKELESKYEFLHTIWLERNVGLGKALAIGVENSRYDLIARMDSDDIAVPDRFEKQLICFKENPEISLVGGDISEFIDKPENVIGIRKCPVTDIEIKKYLKKRCPFNHMTVMFRKEHVLNAGNYIDWKFNEDYYLWIRMYLAGCKFFNLPETLVYVRVGKEMYARRGGYIYFKSEAKLQKYLFDKKIIKMNQFLINIFLRFCIQIIMPNKIRGMVYERLLRK
jgi:glycosyltransferase involved in cell wall biosynthesis